MPRPRSSSRKKTRNEAAAAAEAKQSAAPIADLEARDLYINRELSLLEFQRRVLQEARDEKNPLLERVKFLAILGSNLDEFFMVRVAGLKEQVAAGVVELPPDGLTPAQQLSAIREVASELMTEARDCLIYELKPELEKEGILMLGYEDLSETQRKSVDRYFEEVIFPVLTPLAFDPGRPFPHISNLSLNLAVLIRDQAGKERFARVKVPGTLPRLLCIERLQTGPRKNGPLTGKLHFTWIEQVIAANLDYLFPGMKVLDSHPFRVTRNADMVIQELEAGDLLETIEEGVRMRQFGSVVRVTVGSGMPSHIRTILISNLELHPHDVYNLEGVLGLSGLMTLVGVDRHDLKDPAFLPSLPQPIREVGPEDDIFAAIRRHDILLHHPYDSFTPVIEFLQQAARDPNVLAIKQTLYRVGKDSPVVEALLEARENGKQVAVLVELKARFDEESNINWAKALEREGIHVIYGLLGLKTHSKIALVVRKEGERIRRYMHLSTGNYNAVTAHLYTDLGLFTCDQEIGADATDLFNYLTGYSEKRQYRKLLVAPINLRDEMTRLIHREVEHHRAGRPGRLIFKMNSLVDKPMIQELYRASQAGVQIDLVVRGICCLRPGVPGLSENIQVTSIVGRFLEHSRIYYFRNGGEDQIYLGSADLMPRNINSRVEVLFPIEDIALVRHLRDEVLATHLSDNVKGRRLQPDGSYEYVRPVPGADPVCSQEKFLKMRSV